MEVVGVRLKGTDFAAGDDIPKLDRAIETAGRQDFSIRRKLQRIDGAAMAAKLRQWPPCCQVPYRDAMIRVTPRLTVGRPAKSQWR
jgi:hypothetical protein